MKLPRRRVLQLGLCALLLVWAGYAAVRYYRIKFPNRHHVMTEAMKDLQTVCIGRFLIDVPRGSTIVQVTGSPLDTAFSAETPVSLAEFALRMEERWSQLQEEKTDELTHQPYVQPSKRIVPMPDAVMFNYRYVIRHGPDIYGVVRDRPSHRTQAYLWRNDVLYSFTESVILDDEVIETMRMLQPIQPTQIPTGPGFCGPYSFFPGGGRAESMEIAFRFPMKPYPWFSISMKTYRTPEDLRAITPPRPDLAAYETKNFKSTTFRDATRVVNGLAGVEWADGSTQLRGGSYETSVSADWFHQGEANSSTKPVIRAELNIHYDTPNPPSPWGDFPEKQSQDELSGEEIMAYWDIMLDSLRLRPGAVLPGEK